LNISEGPLTQVLLVRKAELGLFLFRNSERLARTFRALEDPSIASLVPFTAEDPTAENRFLQAGKGAENTKEKSRQCFTLWEIFKKSVPVFTFFCCLLQKNLPQKKHCVT
jgi:hypothetical protein